MSDRTVQVRISEHDEESVAPAMGGDECCGLRRIRPSFYSPEEGLQMATVAII